MKHPYRVQSAVIEATFARPDDVASTIWFKLAWLSWLVPLLAATAWLLFVVVFPNFNVPYFMLYGLGAVLLVGLLFALFSLSSVHVLDTSGVYHAGVGLMLNFSALCGVVILVLFAQGRDYRAEMARREEVAKSRREYKAAERLERELFGRPEDRVPFHPGGNDNFSSAHQSEENMSRSDRLLGDLDENERPEPPSNPFTRVAKEVRVKLHRPPGKEGATIPARRLESTAFTPGPRPHIYSATVLPELKPPELSAPHTNIELPGVLDDVCAAAGGRYLVLKCRESSTLHIFDVQAAKIVRQIEPPTGHTLFTAGAEWLFTAHPQEKLLARWSLATGEFSGVKPLQVSREIRAIGLGDATNGPLYVLSDFEPLLCFDPLSGAEVAYKRERQGDPSETLSEHALRIAPNGSAAALYTSGDSSMGPVAVLDGDTMRTTRVGFCKSDLSFSPNGQFVFAERNYYASNGAYACEAHEYYDRAFLPALRGNLLLCLHYERETGHIEPSSLKLYLPGNDTPLGTIANLKLAKPLDSGRVPGGLSWDKRVWFIPPAKLVIHIPAPFKQLVLHRVDTEALLAQAPQNFLSIDTEPPLGAVPGEPYGFQLHALSQQTPTYECLRGPPGFTVSPAGAVSWPMPADQLPGVYDVVIAASTPDGRQDYLAYTLEVGEKPVPLANPLRLTSATAPLATYTVLPPAQYPQWSKETWPQASQKIKLPGQITDLAVAGGGRYLVLLFQTEQLVCVYDVAQRKIIRQIPAPDSRVFIAGGAEKFVVVLGQKKLVLRYDLATGARERAGRIRTSGIVAFATLGSGSQGPLWLGNIAERESDSLDLYDLETLRPMLAQPAAWSFSASYFPRATYDGQTICGVHPIHNLDLLSFAHDAIEVRTIPNASPAEMKRKSGLAGPLLALALQARSTHDGAPDRSVVVSSLRGDYFLEFPSPTSPNSAHGAQLFQAEITDPIMEVKHFTLPNGQRYPFWKMQESRLPLDKRFVFLPEAGQVLSLPLEGNELVVTPFDPAAEAERPGNEIIVVRSQPPGLVKAGEAFEYQYDVHSSGGEVTYTLESGPEGTNISKNGRLTWASSPDSNRKKVRFVVSLGVGPAKRHLDSFEVQVEPRPQLRTWTSLRGNYAIVAQLSQMTDDGRVLLEDADGFWYAISLRELIPDDQLHVREILALDQQAP